MMKKIHLSVLLMLISLLAVSQQPAFWNDIRQFKKQDSLHRPAKGQILFVGSSSFTRWTDVQQYFPSYQILNRGFGGSTLADVWRYKDDVIIPYQPRQIVMYCGENDFASSDTVTVMTVVNRFVKLFEYTRLQLGDISFVYVSMKPSPSRLHLMPKYEEANKLIEAYLKTKPNTGFVDVYHAMLDGNGRPKAELFVEDNLHMNAKGYAIWKILIQPLLKK